MTGELALRAVEIDVTGHPEAKGRGRAVNTPNGPRIYTPANTQKWEADARSEARAAMGNNVPFGGPCEMWVTAVFPVPRSWPNWKQEAALAQHMVHTSTPDADNIAKIAQDALNGVVFVDDGQVAYCRTTKRYGERPGVYILVRELDQPADAKDWKARWQG